MASVVYGNFIVEARGKIAGNVYSKNKGGAYIRVKVKPTNPQSTRQSAVRANLTTLSQNWRGLTAAQRQSWAQGASNFSIKNRVAQSIILSGNALYVSLNRNLNDVGIAPIDTAPAPAAVDSVAIATAVAANGAQTLIVTLTGAVPANTSLKFFASETVSAGVNSIGSRLRLIESFAAADPAALDVTATYLAKFGTIGAVGSKIFIEIVTVNETTGQVGAAIRQDIVIT